MCSITSFQPFLMAMSPGVSPWWFLTLEKYFDNSVRAFVKTKLWLICSCVNQNFDHFCFQALISLSFGFCYHFLSLKITDNLPVSPRQPQGEHELTFFGPLRQRCAALCRHSGDIKILLKHFIVCDLVPCSAIQLCIWHSEGSESLQHVHT